MFLGFKDAKRLHKVTQTRNMHWNAKKNLGESLLFHELMAYLFFLQIYFKGVFQENKHLLIFDGHG
jgi:hypothetical protein